MQSLCLSASRASPLPPPTETAVVEAIELLHDLRKHATRREAFRQYFLPQLPSTGTRKHSSPR